MLGKRGPAAGAPRHRLVSLVQPALLVADPEKVPDVLNVGVAHRVVGVVPAHPLAKTERLLRHEGAILVHAGATGPGELIQAELLDVAFAVEAELPLGLYLKPQSLAVEAVLPALVEPAHRLVSLEHVLVGAPPGVVHTHRVVRRDRTVDERPVSPAGIALHQSLEDAPVPPEFEDAVLQLDEVLLGVDRGEHWLHSATPPCLRPALRRDRIRPEPRPSARSWSSD